MYRYLLGAATMAMALSTAASANTLYFQINPNFDTGGVRQAFIFGNAGSTGSVLGTGGFNQAFDLGSSGFAVIDIPVSNELSAGSVTNGGFRIESASSLSGYFLNRRAQSTDITYIFDGDRLGTDHVVAGYQNIFPDQVSVQATVDNTVVTFAPRGAAAFDVTLNAGQTYLHTANTNLTGSRVTSSAPIAVFSGNQCTNVPTGVGACDHIVEQLPSVDALSNNYLLAQTPRTGSIGNVVRVVATADATEVKFNGETVATLNAGEFHEGRIAGGVQIEATNKVLVAQYLIGQDQAGANTDPAMTIVPGSDQWLKSYVFATPSGTANFPTDFVSVVINTADIGSLTIDNILADPNAFNALATTAFSYADFDVSDKSGPFTIAAANPFQLLLSGFNSFDSYFTFGGAAFSPGASGGGGVASRLFWDGDAVANVGNGTVDGGTGILTATRSNFTDAGGVASGAYAPQPGTIVFSGTAGIVDVDDVDGAVVVTGMTFLTSDYRIAGDAIGLAAAGNADLGAGNAVFTVGNGGEGDAMSLAMIAAPLTGTAGLAKTGRGTLMLTGPNTYAGGTLVADGTLIGNSHTFGTGAVTNNATLVFNQMTGASFGNGIAGTGAIIKRGTGELTLTGASTATGATTVETGKLTVNGQLATSAVTVRSGATVGGTGRVGALTVQSGGTVAPGGSIGTLTVQGNYNQASGATLDVELASTGAGDRLAVLGTATLAGGAALRFGKTDAPRFVLGTRYTVLTSTLGRTGTFTLSGPTRVSRFIDVVANYDANNAYLDVSQTSRFVTAARTLNQINAATGSDASANGAMFQGIVYLQTDAEAQFAFDQVSGEIHASMRGIAFDDSRFVRQAVLDHLLHPEEARRGVWMQGYGSWGRFRGDGNAAALRRDLGGFFIGTDIINTDTAAFGLVTGYGTGTTVLSDRNSRAEFDDFYLGLYGSHRFGALALRGGTGYQFRKAETRRSIAFTGFSDLAQVRYTSRIFQVYGDISYDFAVGSGTLSPHASAAYVNVNTGSWREGGGSAALRSTGESVRFWTTSLGARFDQPLVADGKFGLSASAAWRHAGGPDLRTPVRMAFAAGPAFDIYGPPVARNAVAAQARFLAKLGANTTLEAGYSGQFGEGRNDHGFNAELSLRF